MGILHALLCCLFLVDTPTTAPASPDARYSIGPVLYSDDFQDLGNWTGEWKGGTVQATDFGLEIDVPGGATVWFNLCLSGPVMIQYDATVLDAGDKNNRVSDLNCFWMANDTRCPDNIFAKPRSGKFTDYDPLLTYYVGLGGNSNTTTRFRRYIGRKDDRPLLPANDLRDKADLLESNRTQSIRLVACGNLIQYWRDDKRIFEYHDPQPYTSGWFGLRTTQNHMIVREFRVFRLEPVK